MGGVDLWYVFPVFRPVHDVHDHVAVVVKFGEFIAVKDQCVFRVAHDSHICFEHLRASGLAEYKVNVVFETVLSGFFYEGYLLLELAEHNHAGGLAFGFGFGA